ncbi:MAG: hypothetical protein PG978_001210 [Wolbachia endosymbiont of Ctenocephalides felis wCfeF]|nr:MAG: hypothetical protein PG978_001210 [Wolbachia endosymbiont of Ctenocephalides felis wCfeF]
MKNNEPDFLQAHILPFLYEDVSSGIRESKEEDVVKMVANVAREEGYDLKEIYGLLLCWAAIQGNIETAGFCIDQGADFDYEDNHRRTPLSLAKHFKQDQMAKTLERWRMRKDASERLGEDFTCLEDARDQLGKLAYSSENPGIGQQKCKILETEIVEFYDRKFCVYIEHGVEKEYIKKYTERNVEQLIQNKECDLKKIYGELLYIAASRGNIEAAKFCKDHGADLEHGKKTALWQARRSGNNQMVEALEEWGAHGENDQWWDKPRRGGDTVKSFYDSMLSPSVEQGLNKENSARAVEDFVRNKEYEPKKVYGELLCYAAAQGIALFIEVRM